MASTLVKRNTCRQTKRLIFQDSVSIPSNTFKLLGRYFFCPRREDTNPYMSLLGSTTLASTKQSEGTKRSKQAAETSY